MRRSKDKDRPHYDGPTTDKPQNASLAKYAPAYLEQSVRARTLVSLMLMMLTKVMMIMIMTDAADVRFLCLYSLFN